MIGDAFVFDGVAHPFNFTEKNVYDRAGEMFRQHLYAFHQVLTPDTEPKLSAEQYLKDWTPADIHEMVYEHSDTDMLVAMPLPLTVTFPMALMAFFRKMPCSSARISRYSPQLERAKDAL